MKAEISQLLQVTFQGPTVFDTHDALHVDRRHAGATPLYSNTAKVSEHFQHNGLRHLRSDLGPSSTRCISS